MQGTTNVPQQQHCNDFDEDLFGFTIIEDNKTDFYDLGNCSYFEGKLFSEPATTTTTIKYDLENCSYFDGDLFPVPEDDNIDSMIREFVEIDIDTRVDDLRNVVFIDGKLYHK